MRRRYLPRGIYVALGLLTMCAVFAATAGVREALLTRTQALRQELAAATPLSKSITASANWNAVSTALESASLGGVPVSNLTAAQITEISGQLHAGFDHGAVSLAPASTDWESLTTGANLVQSALPAVGSHRGAARADRTAAAEPAHAAGRRALPRRAARADRLQVPLPLPVLRQRQPAVLPADAGRGDEADGGHVRPPGRLEGQGDQPAVAGAQTAAWSPSR